MTIRLHIDRLVLDGLPGGLRNRASLQLAIEQELATLLGQADPRDWHPAHHRSLQVQGHLAPSQSLGQQIALNTVQAVTGQATSSRENTP